MEETVPKTTPDPVPDEAAAPAATAPDLAEVDTTEAQFDEMFAAGVPVEVEPAPVWGNWRYLGHRTDIVYTAVPVTPAPGDVVGWWGPPGHDGCWEQTDAEPTRMPDNHRPDITEEQAAKLRGDTTDNA